MRIKKLKSARVAKVTAERVKNMGERGTQMLLKLDISNCPLKYFRLNLEKMEWRKYSK